VVDNFLRTTIFGRGILDLFFIPYIFAIEYSPEDMKIFSARRSSVANNIFLSLESKYQGTPVEDLFIDWEQIKQWYKSIKTGGHVVGTVTPSFAAISGGGLENISRLLKGSKEETVKTKWITAEIDKITALIYFMVTISVFIVAIVILPNLLQKFAQEFEDTSLIRLGILIFSVGALAAVSYMLIHRILELLKKASIVFSYLTALTAIKVDKEKFKENLQNVEGYLNSNDWTLAEYWINRIQNEYTELFLNKVSISDPSPVKDSNTGGLPSYIR